MTKIVYDWAKIETDYITDPAQTYRSLSQKYGPRPKTVCEHAQAAGWQAKRATFSQAEQLKTQEKLADMRAAESADEIAKMNKAHYDSQQALKFLTDKKVIAEVDRVKNGEPDQLSIKQLQELAATQKIVQDGQRLAKGLADRELNISLIHKQLTPLLERIVQIIEEHAPQAREAILREFTALFG
ncbi:MAG: hypothetical protein HY920_03005 [Elusimicrobia bacterium]|nr:hypothetical protein [Elusimicrobiota bacterium]